MALLKDKYGDKAKFYFVEFNQESAQPVIEKFNIQKHPETIILNKEDEIAFKMEGFEESTGIKQLESEIIKVLNEK